MKLDEFMTIKQVREDIFSNYEEGLHCPVCGQFVKLYKRKLTSSMAYALVLIYRFFKNHPDETWLHVEEYLKKLAVPHPLRGDFHKLRYWGLLEKKEGEREDKNPNVGYYRITEKGIMFVKNELKLPKHVFLYNCEVKGFNDEIEIDIQNAFGNKFNYHELMKECESP